MTTIQGSEVMVRAPVAGEGTPGYLISSFELRTGVEVSLLAVASLPAEVLRELQRLRRCWDDGPSLIAGVPVQRS
jgi:hypothetical protein